MGVRDVSLWILTGGGLMALAWLCTWPICMGMREPALVSRVQLRKRSAFVMTDAELKLIASAAIIGDSSQPVSG